MGKILIHIIPAICSCLFIQIILHEIGHFVGGHLTGWKLIYIQLHRFIIKQTDKGMKIMVVKGVGYRCIMYPKSILSDALLYTIGGCIINILSAAIGVFILVKVAMCPVLWLYTWSFTAFGIGVFFMNWTERIGRVCNDKACYRMLKDNIHTKLCHNSQLIIARQLMIGLTYSEICREKICLCSYQEVNDIEAYQVVLEYYYYLDIQDYIRAEQALGKIKDTEYISKEVLDVIKLERIYILLLTALRLINKNQIKIFHSQNELENHIRKYGDKGDIHSLRIMDVYEAYKNYKSGFILKAVESLNETVQMMNNTKCVYEGEKIFCIKQIDIVKNVIEQYLVN